MLFKSVQQSTRIGRIQDYSSSTIALLHCILSATEAAGMVEVRLATAATAMATTERGAGVIFETAAEATNVGGAMTGVGGAMTADQPTICHPLLSWTKFHSSTR